MCGRYTLTDPDPRILRFRFELSETAQIEEEPRFNIAPTDAVLAVRLNKEGEREPGRLRWGLIPHYADPDDFARLLINARAETVAEAPAFRDAFATHRCLVVADGFYEWRATETGKQPTWIARPDRKPFAFAGLWARSRREDGTALHSCTIVTCPPSELVAPVHDRMPVVLEQDSEAGWLDPKSEPESLTNMLRPYEELELTEVCDAVNTVQEDGPHLLEAPMKLF
jgi:putative SOS response-associated peptidase YedK